MKEDGVEVNAEVALFTCSLFHDVFSVIRVCSVELDIDKRMVNLK
jgi:hypothetical protein